MIGMKSPWALLYKEFKGERNLDSQFAKQTLEIFSLQFKFVFVFGIANLRLFTPRDVTYRHWRRVAGRNREINPSAAALGKILAKNALKIRVFLNLSFSRTYLNVFEPSYFLISRVRQ